MTRGWKEYYRQPEFRFIDEMAHWADCLQNAKAYPVEYCLKTIRNEPMLWDMRWWRKLKDLREIHEWLDSYFSNRGGYGKNCGHVGFCIGLLLHVHKVPRERIVEAVLANNKVCYADRKESDGVVREPDIYGPFHFRERRFSPLLSEEDEERIREEDDGGIQERRRADLRGAGAGVRRKERALAHG